MNTPDDQGFLGRGWSFPPRFLAAGAEVGMVAGVDDVHQSLQILLTTRLGERTKHLVKRLHPGDVAVIDHLNIDRIAAEELIAAGVVAVINASPSSDGAYPNAGPLMLCPAIAAKP